MRRFKANRSRCTTLPGVEDARLDHAFVDVEAHVTYIYKESWEFSRDCGKTEGNPLGFSSRSGGRSVDHESVLHSSPNRAETATTSSSSKLNRVGRRGAHIRRRARSP